MSRRSLGEDGSHRSVLAKADQPSTRWSPDAAPLTLPPARDERGESWRGGESKTRLLACSLASSSCRLACPVEASAKTDPPTEAFSRRRINHQRDGPLTRRPSLSPRRGTSGGRVGEGGSPRPACLLARSLPRPADLLVPSKPRRSRYPEKARRRRKPLAFSILPSSSRRLACPVEASAKTDPAEAFSRRRKRKRRRARKQRCVCASDQPD